MQDDLESLKANPRILGLYGQYTKLTKAGDRWSGKCPLHSDSNPSFSVWTKDLMWTCFSGCGSGNIFQMIERKENIPFKEAVNKVRAYLGEDTWSEQKAIVEQTFKSVAQDEKPKRTFSLAQYKPLEDALEKSSEGKAWLKSRGISYETAKTAHVGFKQNVGALCGEKNAGISDKGWIAFPCIEGDQVVSIKYRSIVEKVFCKQAGMKTALFNTETIDIFEPVYLLEGECDCLVMEQAGFRAVSLASASSYPTPEQKDMLMQAAYVVLAGDMDGAVGEEVMGKLWRELKDRTYLLKWADHKDANDVFLKGCGGDVEKFRGVVEKLTKEARRQVLPDVYNLQDVLLSGDSKGMTEHPQRLRFPWPSVDKMTILLPGSILSMMATATGMGKTIWSVQASLHGAMNHGERVLNYQCEMSADEVATMVAANVLNKHRNHLSMEDRKQASEMLEGVQYYVGYNPSLSTVGEVLDLLEAAIRRLSITVCILDHIHFICRNEQNEVQAQANAMQRIKRIAVQYGVKFIVVGQPRKQTHQTKGKMVHLSDGKGSETFASDATAFIALHRETVKNDNPDAPQRDIYDSKTQIHLLKSRFKGDGDAVANLVLFGEFAKFNEIDYSHAE